MKLTREQFSDVMNNILNEDWEDIEIENSQMLIEFTVPTDNGSDLIYKLRNVDKGSGYPWEVKFTRSYKIETETRLF